MVVVAMVVPKRGEGGEKTVTMPPAEVTKESMPRTARGGEEGMYIHGTHRRSTSTSCLPVRLIPVDIILV